MKQRKQVAVALLLGALLVATTGCQKQEGPAEHAGKEVDKAVQKSGEKIFEKLGDNIQDAAKGDKK